MQIRGLEKIESFEAYNEAKEQLNYYVSEYRWMLEAENSVSEDKKPKTVVETELRACSKALRAGMETDDEFKLLARIHELKTKYIAIINEQYKPALKRNINGLVLMIEQFEAAHQNINFTDLVKGILSGDNEVKEYLRKKYTFTLANMYGTAPAPECLNVEKMEDILDYMDKNYSLVDIELEGREARAERLANENQLAIATYEEPVIGLKAKVLERTNLEADKVIADGSIGVDYPQPASKSRIDTNVIQPNERKVLSKKPITKDIEEGEIEK